jgi:hypothetical protein
MCWAWRLAQVCNRFGGKRQLDSPDKATEFMTRDRYLLMALVLWGLVMIVPDLWRVVQPLGSFGLYADNDGLIYDVTGPFLEESASPAYRAGIRVGDRVDLTQTRCHAGEARQ